MKSFTSLGCFTSLREHELEHRESIDRLRNDLEDRSREHSRNLDAFMRTKDGLTGQGADLWWAWIVASKEELNEAWQQLSRLEEIVGLVPVGHGKAGE